MSILFAAMGAMLSTLMGAAFFAAPIVPAKMAQMEKFAATLPDDPALTLRSPARVLFRAHRQLPDAYYDCADGGDDGDGGNNDFTADTPPLASQAAPDSPRAVRTIC